jgi:hypothetical protein
MKDAQLAPSEKQSLTKSADGRMATEAARLKQKTSDKKKKNQLDTNRPSHGRTWQSQPAPIADNHFFIYSVWPHDAA